MELSFTAPAWRPAARSPRFISEIIGLTGEERWALRFLFGDQDVDLSTVNVSSSEVDGVKIPTIVRGRVYRRNAPSDTAFRDLHPDRQSA